MPVFVFLIAPGFSDSGEKLELTINLTRITFPFLLFVSLSSMLAGILNTNNKFAAAAAAPIVLNIVLFIILVYDSFTYCKFAGYYVLLNCLVYHCLR